MSPKYRPFHSSLGLALCAAVLSLGATSGNAASVSMIQTRSGSFENQFTVEVEAPGTTGEVFTSAEKRISVTDTIPAPMTFDYFDSSLGTLEAVNIIYRTAKNAARGSFLKFTNLECAEIAFDPACRTKETSAEVDVTYGAFVEVGRVKSVDITRSATGRISQNTTNPSQTFPIVSRDLVKVSIFPGSFAQEFVGTGDFTVRPYFTAAVLGKVLCRPDFGLGGLANIISKCTGTSVTTYAATYSVSVEYVYDDGINPPKPNVVPLPAGLPMLAGALGLLGFLRRRR